MSSGRVYLYTASILAVVFVGLRAGLFSILFNAVVLLFMLWQVSQGRISYDPPQMVNNWITTTTVFIAVNMFTTVSAGLLVRALAVNLAVMQDFTYSLEQRVAERTRVIEAGVEVSRAVSGILDSAVLVQEVVERIRSAFDYYHTQIYLLDEAGEKLLLAGGTGDTGRTMLAAGYFVLPGQGIVGQAAVLTESILVPDVMADERWQPNPLLPETKGETAVPIAIGDEVLGVLDVQVAQVNGLSADDVSFLQAITGQVAVAIRNARLYEATERRVYYETHVNMIGQQIQQAATLEEVLQVAAQELEQVLGAQRVTVQLGSNGHGRNH
jgi:putative methionine-R-sulfoxide reductase with GAF domain